MGKIIESINRVHGEGGTTVSFEFFPAKTEKGVNNLLYRIETMAAELQPTFVTLTWRSAFKDEDLWLRIGSIVQNRFGVDILMHLTTHLAPDDLRRILRRCREANIRNILALRGDPPIGEETFVPAEGGFTNAIDLVRLIREEHGDYFCVCVAGYPEAHTECWNAPDDLPPSHQSMEVDIERLKEKVDAGSDFIITQFFYNVDKFLEFVVRCREAGIACPILPGYLPVQNYNAFKKFSTWCKTEVPHDMAMRLEDIKDDDAQVKDFGVECAVRASKRILAMWETEQHQGRSLHFYTMNLPVAVTRVLTQLGLMPKREQRALPWQTLGAPSGSSRVSGKNGAQEDVRPIFWQNRQTSYVMRTTGWDEFPNGRWGAKESPAYGDLTDYYLAYRKPKVDRKEMWGTPLSPEDVHEVFVGFIEGSISALPWCEQTSLETSLISEDLRFINSMGFLTINSQPHVNGVPSNDPTFGWGGDSGYVFQKAYLEFFCSPDNFRRLLDKLEDMPNLAYQAINHDSTQEFTNCTSANANAVTWGIFPGREIVQPTVVDNASFRIWKDEAFALWMSQWAGAYSDEETADSRAVIKEIHDTYFLVNIVDNDYVGEETDIFAVFRAVIADAMTDAQLRVRVATLEHENEGLRRAMSELRTLQLHAGDERSSLLQQLAAEQMAKAQLEKEVHVLKVNGACTSLPRGPSSTSLSTMDQAAARPPIAPK